MPFQRPFKFHMNKYALLGNKFSSDAESGRTEMVRWMPDTLIMQPNPTLAALPFEGVSGALVIKLQKQ